MLYSTNDITFIYYGDEPDIIIPGMDKPSDISIRKDLLFKSLTINIIISDSQCRSLFGHDFMRSPDYRIYTLQGLYTCIKLSRECGNSMDIDNNKALLNRLKTAYQLIQSIDRYLIYGTNYIENLYVNDEDGDIYTDTPILENCRKQIIKQIEKITITPLNELASTDPLYATLQTDCMVSLPYDKWVISYHFTRLPSNYHVGQIYIPNDTLTRVHRFWLTNHINYKNMYIINRQLKQCDECALIIEIQAESNNGAPKEMLQYIFGDHG